LYKNDKDVIAVFDIDYKKMAEIGRCKRDTMASGVFGGSCFMFVIALNDDWQLNFLLWILVALLAWLAMHYITFVFQMLRRHNAIANRGVYIDDVDEPGSVRLVRRQIIALDAIEGCHVVVVGGCRPTYQAVIRAKVDHGLFAMVKEHVFPGLIEAQTFADTAFASLTLNLLSSWPDGTSNSISLVSDEPPSSSCSRRFGLERMVAIVVSATSVTAPHFD
jgi:hypothetical protein